MNLEYRCPGCGCTDARACDGGCYWVRDDDRPVCSTCHDAQSALQALVRAQPGSGPPSKLQLALQAMDDDLRPEVTELVHAIAVPLAVGNRARLDDEIAKYRKSDRVDRRALVRPDSLEMAMRQARLLIDFAREEVA